MEREETPEKPASPVGAPPAAIPQVPALVVSIHDVCPGSMAEAERMLADLSAAGAGAVSLLVIPDRHGKDPAWEDRGFVRWLEGREGLGHEVVLHGYYHLRVAAHEAKGIDAWVSQKYTAGEGEFYDLAEAEASRLLERGLREMEENGFTPRGFIAPAWLMGEGAWGAVRRAPFEYTTTLGAVHDLRSGLSYASQSLCYSVRAPWRRACSLAWNSLLLAWLDDAPLVRLGLHPPDWRHPAIRSHALRCARWALAQRPAMTYWSWLSSQRNLSLNPHP